MMSPGQNANHLALLRAISNVGGVACELTPELFFPEDISNPKLRNRAEIRAMALCNLCPIRQRCLEYAIDAGESYGIWGGQTAAARARYSASS